MAQRKVEKTSAEKTNDLTSTFPNRSDLPSWFFEKEELSQTLKSAKTVDQRVLVNKLNHIHFRQGYVLVHLRHPKFEDFLLLKAYPEPCLENHAICRWANGRLSAAELGNYRFQYLLIDDGQGVILVPGRLQEMDADSLKIELPRHGYAVGQRQVRRFRCSSQVRVEVTQSGFLAGGRLMDFSPKGFRIRLEPRESCSFSWFNPDELVTLQLRDHQRILLSNVCRVLRQRNTSGKKEIVLEPADEIISRFEKKQIRNPRQLLVPSPMLVFDHPLLRRRVQLEVMDISTSGFSVYEKADEGMLIQGMIIPDLIVEFPGASELRCTAQVLYRLDEGKDGVRCGLAILDMGLKDYGRLTNVLANALDRHAYISNNVDIEALWEFFFETGFIYPKKYDLIQSHREEFAETYKKLYQESPEIAKHFTYEMNGRIYGHISMVRAYEKAWIIQHHAARYMQGKRAAFSVLKQVMLYLNDIHRFPSANLDYMLVYFRPENKFPDRVFGSFTRDPENAGICSMDLFSYITVQKDNHSAEMPAGWSLSECSSLNYWELKRFYRHYSGGLLLRAMNLEEEGSTEESLETVYHRLGFFRRWRKVCLSCRGQINAILVMNQSDLGINLSELINGIKVMVIKPDGLPWEVLRRAIDRLTGVYDTEKIPVLIYPAAYVKNNDVSYEKEYQVCVCDARYVSRFMQHLQRKFRAGYWE